MRRIKLAQGVTPYLAFFLLLLILEWAFDIFEIGIGEYMRISNTMRQKSGRYWTEEKKTEEGVKESAAISSVPKQPVKIIRVNSIEELNAILLLNHSYQMTREEFLNFYKSLPAAKSKELLDPLQLYSLSRRNEWRTTRFVLFGKEIQMYFLDGYKQLITEVYYRIDRKKTEVAPIQPNQLDSEPQFSGRVVPANLFFTAFDKIGTSYQLQIVNDPARLVQWESDLKRVGISRFAENSTALMIFEVKFGDGNSLYEIRASEIAVGYLLSELNSLGYRPPLLPLMRGGENL